MYRANDPRFRRRLNEIGQTLENANESAQSNIYIFAQTYIKPCFESISACATTCVDASCPSLNISQRDRLRRQRGRSRGDAELSFDFYDDWDEEENDALLGWAGSDDLDELITSNNGYGTVAQSQPARGPTMNYPKGRRKSTTQILEGATDVTVIPGGSGFFARLFGSRALTYKPSAAGLQDHPGARHQSRPLTEGESLLFENETPRRGHRRQRSATASSGQTSDSLSSRGDIFPSDAEDDAVPIDDEFAMVLERRVTPTGDHETSNSSTSAQPSDRKRRLRPSFGSRTSTGRVTHSSRGRRSTGSTVSIPVNEATPEIEQRAPSPPTLAELKDEENAVAIQEEAEIQRRREDAHKLAEQRGLLDANGDDLSVKETTPAVASPILATSQPPDADGENLETHSLEAAEVDGNDPAKS